ncbi:MAG: SUMF1/EgtB/PvdO family nonheme iron enzyme, partial [Myxococcota bacterium]
MHGTVWEWCWSSFQPYPLEDELRPVGALRVLRGGSFYIGAAWLRSAIRLRGAPGDRYRVVGFRCSGPFLPSSALEP